MNLIGNHPHDVWEQEQIKSEFSSYANFEPAEKTKFEKAFEIAQFVLIYAVMGAIFWLGYSLLH